MPRECFPRVEVASVEYKVLQQLVRCQVTYVKISKTDLTWNSRERL